MPSSAAIRALGRGWASSNTGTFCPNYGVGSLASPAPRRLVIKWGPLSLNPWSWWIVVALAVKSTTIMERPRPQATIHDHGGSRTPGGCIPNPKRLTWPLSLPACWLSSGPANS